MCEHRRFFSICIQKRHFVYIFESWVPLFCTAIRNTKFCGQFLAPSELIHNFGKHYRKFGSVIGYLEINLKCR